MIETILHVFEMEIIVLISKISFLCNINNSSYYATTYIIC